MSTCRAYTPGGPGPIPWTSVEEYKDRNELDEVDAYLLDHVIVVLDNAFFTRLAKTQETKKPKQTVKKSGRKS